MIFHFNKSKLEKDKISFKQPFYYTEELIYIPILYKKQNLLVQTPHLFVPFGIKDYENKKTIDLSIQDFDSNVKSKSFLNEWITPLTDIIKFKYPEHSLLPVLRESKYSKWMRIKVSNNTLFFNQTKEQLSDIENKVFGTFVIHFSGVWILKNKIWINMTLIQGKVYETPTFNKYIIIDDEDTIYNKIPPAPPPPPPPPPKKMDKYNKMIKVGIPIVAVEKQKAMDRIQAKDLQNVKLKKTKVNDKKESSATHSLEEIRLVLQKLQKTTVLKKNITNI